MEIDLNLAVFDEMEKNACSNGGECNHFSLASSTSSYSSNAAASTSSSSSPPSTSLTLSSSSIYLELWHACAGPVAILPKKGDLVVYFPQGHLEQANSSMFSPTEIASLDLPPQILCRVVDVQLIANKENDEVYTQLTLHPMPQIVGVKLEGIEKEHVGLEEGGSGEAPAKSTSHMFCKTLTASDTSSHGGFSVPRRAAEDCFPPLNYVEQRPSQELVATDLHGVEWKFRHIYRGQPRRHLLTTGWSNFVSQKNLVSGDAVMFLRGEAGDLRLGIRRAARPRNSLPDSIINNQNCYPNVLSHVANAIPKNGMFNVVYSPRESHSNFIVPYQTYLKYTASPVPVGARFKMKYDMDDSPERRCSGVVTGVGDVDPYRWPNSKWRSLVVRWDGVVDHQERVSPWDINLSSSYAPPSIQTFPAVKRLRLNLQASPNGSSLFTEGGLVSDFEEYVRSSKVLQGQENAGFVSPVHKHHPIPAAPNRMQNISNGEFVRNQAPATFTGFLESNWFPKVLQGQEICSFRTLAGWDHGGALLKPRRGCNFYKAYQFPTPSFYPLASEGARNMTFSPNFNPLFTPSFTAPDVGRLLHFANEARAPETDLEKAPICRLFGCSLTDDSATLNVQRPKVREAIVRHSYDKLLIELKRLFSVECLVHDPNHGGLVHSDRDEKVGSMAVTPLA